MKEAKEERQDEEAEEKRTPKTEDRLSPTREKERKKVSEKIFFIRKKGTEEGRLILYKAGLKPQNSAEKLRKQ